MIPISVEQAYKNAKSERELAQLNLKRKRTFIKMEPAQFKELLLIKSERIFYERAEPRTYDFDENNKSLIQQLYYYAIGSKKFTGSLYKGIHLWGNYGTGKTTVMQALCEIISENTGKTIEMILSKNFGNLILTKGIDYFVSRPIFLDDLGREIKELKDYGNIIRPVSDIWYLRKEKGSWTFQTCQMQIKELEKLYGAFTVDRMRASFNEIEFKGSSRRK